MTTFIKRPAGVSEADAALLYRLTAGCVDMRDTIEAVYDLASRPARLPEVAAKADEAPKRGVR